MDITSIDNGKFAVIKTKQQFVLIINEEIFGPFLNTKANVRRVKRILKNPNVIVKD